MHPRGLRLLSSLLVALVATFAAAVPASADGGDADPPVGDDGSNLVGRVAEQIDQINSGSPGGGASKPPSCDWVERDPNAPPGPPMPPGELGPNDKVRHDGSVRWTEPWKGHGFWEEDDLFSGKGTVFRYECWHEDMAKNCTEESPDGRCMGRPISLDWCEGGFLCEFDAVNPQNIALLAVDDFVKRLPPPEPHFNPPNGTYVNFPTWMWVEGLPPGGTMPPETISVPGLTVTTTADLDKVNWTMGDGGEKECGLTVTEASAETCTYEYMRSSANQPNNVYTGQASTVWQAVWTIQQTGQSGNIDAPRSTDFNLAVAEIQTVVQ